MSDFDHGLLNLPLSKRGNIDREIDRYKKEVQSLRTEEEKAARRDWRLKVAEAKRLVNGLSDERLTSLGETHSLTAKQVRKQLLLLARSRPIVLADSLLREQQS